MLHFLVLVVDTLLLALVLFGALMGFAWQRGLFEVRTPAKYGLFLGILTAAVLAGLKMGTGFVVREYYNLAVLAVMIPAEFFLMCGLVVTRFLSSEKAASSLMRVLFFLTAATWGAFYFPDIFIFPSHFAVGVVQVVSSEFVFIVTGYLAGLVICFLCCWSVYKICLSAPMRVLFPFIILLQILFMLLHLVNVGQILVGRGILPRYDWLLDLMIFLLNHARGIAVLMLAIGVALALIVWAVSRRAPVQGGNAAEKRKCRSRLITRMRWSKGCLVLLVVSVLVMTAGVYLTNRKVELSPPMPMEAAEGHIIIPLSLVNDGKLHRFVHTTPQGTDIRYIIIRKSETAYGVGLDACDVCGSGGGYYERKGQVICILCDVVMNKSTIGFPGGCNPVPLPFSVEDGSIVIKTDDLEAEEPRFL